MLLFVAGTSCGHLDEGIFDDELMTGYVNNVRRCPCSRPLIHRDALFSCFHNLTAAQPVTMNEG